MNFKIVKVKCNFQKMIFLVFNVIVFKVKIKRIVIMQVLLVMIKCGNC